MVTSSFAPSCGGSVQTHAIAGECSKLHSNFPSLPHRQTHSGAMNPQHSHVPSSTRDPASHSLPSTAGGDEPAMTYLGSVTSSFGCGHMHITDEAEHSYLPALSHWQSHSYLSYVSDPQHSYLPSSTIDPASHIFPFTAGGHVPTHPRSNVKHCQAPFTHLQL